MTVAELREKLEQYPSDWQIHLTLYYEHTDDVVVDAYEAERQVWLTEARHD